MKIKTAFRTLTTQHQSDCLKVADFKRAYDSLEDPEPEPPEPPKKIHENQQAINPVQNRNQRQCLQH